VSERLGLEIGRFTHALLEHARILEAFLKFRKVSREANRAAVRAVRIGAYDEGLALLEKLDVAWDTFSVYYRSRDAVVRQWGRLRAKLKRASLSVPMTLDGIDAVENAIVPPPGSPAHADPRVRVRQIKHVCIVRLRALAEEAMPEGRQSDDGSSTKTDWREIQQRLLRLRDQGEPYTNQGKLAGRLGCSKTTINKAISDSTTLKGWMARHRKGKATPRATSLNEVIADNVPQSREPDPADVLLDEEVDAVMSRLIQQADPDKRAKLNALGPDGRRGLVKAYLEHVDDPESAPPDLSNAHPKPVRLLGRKL